MVFVIAVVSLVIEVWSEDVTTVSVDWPVQFNCQSFHCVPLPVPLTAAVQAAWSSVTILILGCVCVEYQTSLEGDRDTEPVNETTLKGLILTTCEATF